MEIRKRRGSILVLSLWSLALLTAFAVSMGYMVRQKLTLFDRIEKRDFLWNSGWSAVEKARAVMRSDADLEVDSFMESWANDKSLFRDVAVQGATFSVGYTRQIGKEEISFWGLSDEQGKLNLNKAKPSAVSLLIQQVTDLRSEEADQLGHAIVDWADGDSAYGHPDFGAEDSDYGGLPKPYEAKDLPIENPDELLLVKGMNRAIFEKMKPYVTVFGPGTVNLNTASREVLVAIGLNKAVAEKIVAHRDGDDGIPATSDDRVFANLSISQAMQNDESPLSDDEVAFVDDLAGSGEVSVTTGTFGITATARSLDGRAEVHVDAVVNRDGEVLFFHSSGLQWRSK